MFCAISGKPPLHPVVSTKSKCLFEKSLLIQYVNENGVDPITKVSMTPTDIIEIDLTTSNSNTNVLNSSTLNTNYSIPNLLSTLQNEWDSIMQENFILRQKLDILSKNLSQALYERDAAKLIAAKYMSGGYVPNVSNNNNNNDNNDTNTTTTNNNSNNSNNDINATFKLDLNNLIERSKQYMLTTKPIIKKINLLQKNLIDIIASYRTVKLIKPIPAKYPGLYPISTYPLKTVTDIFNNYITLVSIDNNNNNHNDNPGLYIISLGEDKFINFSNDATSSVCYVPDQDSILFSGKDTNDTCTLYNIHDNSKYSCTLNNESIIGMFYTDGVYDDQLNDFSNQERIGFNYLVACSSGNVYLINDNQPYPLIKQSIESKQETRFIGSSLHKDGLLIAVFNTKEIFLLNISDTSKPPVQVPINDHHFETIKSVKFSSNGYWLFVFTNTGIITFDLRKSPMTSFSLNINNDSNNNNTNNNTHVECDVIASGKIMATFDNVTKIVKFYRYEKTTNQWSIIKELTINDLSDTNDKYRFNLLYSNEQVGCLLYGSNAVYKYIFE